MSSVQLIHDALSNLLYPYGDNFRQAETNLSYLAAQPEFVVHLLELTLDATIDLAVRRLGSVSLKNKISKSWSSRAADQISDGDKHLFKSHLTQAIISCHPSLQDFFVICLSRVMDVDYACGRWPELLSEIKMLLSKTENVSCIVGGLRILRQVCKYYRWNVVKVNQQLNPLMSEFYPTILEISEAAVSAVQMPNDNDDMIAFYYEIIYETLKIYKLSTSRFLPEIYREEKFAERTVGMFLRVFMLPLPASVLSITPNADRKSLVPVKCQKWATGNIYRTHSNYLTKAYSNVSENAAVYAPYRQKFLTQFSPEISELYIQRLQAWSQKQVWLSDSVIYNVFTYLAAMIEFKSIFTKVVEPQFKGLLGEVAFSLMCPTEDELDLFEDDPIEFIQRQDDLNIRQTPAQVAADFVSRTVRKRKSMVELVMEFLQQCANKIVDQPSFWKERIGLMKLLNALEHLFLANGSPYKDYLESMMSTFVIPDLSSSIAYLRYEACNTINTLCHFKFKSRDSTQKIFQGVLNCFFDLQNLPTQVSAALTLQTLSGIEQNEDVRAVLRVHIPEIIRKLLTLTETVDMEALLGVLDSFVEQFPDQITPFAADLAAQLRHQFIGVAAEMAEVQRQLGDSGGGIMAESDVMEISNEKTNTGFGIMNFLANLQNNFEHQKELTLKLDEVIAPVFQAVYQHKLVDFYADCLSLHENTLFTLKSVPLHHWKYFELIMTILQNTQLDYFEDAMPVFENYIAFGSDFLAKNTAMLESFVKFLVSFYRPSKDVAEPNEPTAIFTKARTQASIMSLATKLLVSSELFNGPLRPQVEEMVDAVIARVGADALSGSSSFPPRYNVATVSMVLGGIYHYPESSLMVLHNRDAFDAFLETWSMTLPEFTRVNDLKLSILAALSLTTYQISHSRFTTETQAKIWKILIHCLEVIPGAASRVVELMKEDELGWNDDNDDDDDLQEFDYDYDDEEDESEGEKDASAEFGDLMPEGSAVTGEGHGIFMYEQPGGATKGTKQSSSNDEPLDLPENKPAVKMQYGFVADDFDENIYSVSPLDGLNPYDAIRTVIQGMQISRPDLYMSAMSLLSEIDKAILDESLQRASLPTYTRSSNN